MITFYPGPAKIYEAVPQLVQEAYQAGILSANHRSPEFQELYRQAKERCFHKLNVPSDYELLFVSSATECWEIIAQSFTEKLSLHVYNGAFGQKWFEYATRLTATRGQFFRLNESIPVEFEVKEPFDVICITQNETSNGTQVTNQQISNIRANYDTSIIAIDATSSLAGIELDISQADIWYASVQKCFGLPAGMGVMICSPRAVAKAAEVDDRNHYNSFNFMLANASKFQTHYTPNVLNIYLLARIMEKIPDISQVGAEAMKKFEHWQDLIDRQPELNWLVENKEVRSNTVLPVKAAPENIAAIKNGAKAAGIVLGNGYGNWKKDTFRIANFPAITWDEIRQLTNFLEHYFH